MLCCVLPHAHAAESVSAGLWSGRYSVVDGRTNEKSARRQFVILMTTSSIVLMLIGAQLLLALHGERLAASVIGLAALACMVSVVVWARRTGRLARRPRGSQ
jgi:lysylphosphatidylglycerol synthetase-like protein (DUF2156 family)